MQLQEHKSQCGHQKVAVGKDSENVFSLDVTDPRFEKEVLSELVAYDKEDDADMAENEEALQEFLPYDNEPEGPNMHVEEEIELINIGNNEDVKEVL